MNVLKWAGGKTSLVNELKQRTPKKYTLYVEPFFGSGGSFFGLNPQSEKVISDINPNVMRFWLAVRDAPDELIEYIKYIASFPITKEHYLTLRKKYNENKEMDYVERAAIFYALNHLCYNALYRENRKGDFNVPWGKRDYLLIAQTAIKDASEKLRRCNMLNASYEKLLPLVDAETFLYCDPPYYGTFDSYTKGGNFDHKKLRDLLTDLSGYVMISYNDRPEVRELYRDWNIEGVVATQGMNRSKRNEVIITNYRG